MALGWALQRMSHDQYRKILAETNDHVKRNFTILLAIRDEILPDEDLLTFIEAMDGAKNRNCLLALTDQRLIVAFKHRRGRFELDIIPFDELVFDGYRRTRMFGRLDIWRGKEELHFNCMDKDRMDSFGQYFVDQFDSWRMVSSFQDQIEIPEFDVPQEPMWLDELERLTDLWQSGALDDAEFQQAKRRLLS